MSELPIAQSVEQVSGIDSSADVLVIRSAIVHMRKDCTDVIVAFATNPPVEVRPGQSSNIFIAGSFKTISIGGVDYKPYDDRYTLDSLNNIVLLVVPKPDDPSGVNMTYITRHPNTGVIHEGIVFFTK